MSLVLLKDLNPNVKRARVLVRVSRLWEYRGGRDDGDLRHLDLVLLDSEGYPMYAEVGYAALKTKMPLLQEGKVYTLTRFMVVDSKKTYRPVETRYMIDITCHTLIEEYTDVPSDFPLYVYNLKSFPSLAALLGETKSFIDVVGMIAEVSDAETVQLTNQPAPTRRRTLTLRDTSNDEMKLFIYGRRADEFNAAEVLAMGQGEPVVAIFVGLLVKPNRNGNSLSGNSACRWYINADIPEIRSFVASLDGMFQPVVHITAGVNPEAARQPLPEPEMKELAELAAMSPYDFPPQGFRSVVTVTRINDNTSWYFASCNRCSKKSIPEGDGYRCPSCYCTSSKFKYKICLFASDGTAEEEFVFFGDIGRRLVRKEVRQLMRAVANAGDMPSEIASLVGQKYQLAFTVTGRSFQRMERSYQVRQVICGYGRQNVVPAVRAPPPPPPRAPGEGRGSAGLVSTTASATSTLVIAATSTENPAVEVRASASPPQPSPIQTSPVLERQTMEKDDDQLTDRKVRKRLFKDDASAAEAQSNPELDDDIDGTLEADVPGGKNDHLVALPAKGSSNAPTAKKTKIN